VPEQSAAIAYLWTPSHIDARKQHSHSQKIRIGNQLNFSASLNSQHSHPSRRDYVVVVPCKNVTKPCENQGYGTSVD
jgi:hypothetical protein